MARAAGVRTYPSREVVRPNQWIRIRFERAIVEQARVMPLEAITVRSTCARARLGRHTFFQAFASLEDAKRAALRHS